MMLVKLILFIHKNLLDKIFQNKIILYKIPIIKMFCKYFIILIVNSTCYLKHKKIFY